METPSPQGLWTLISVNPIAGRVDCLAKAQRLARLLVDAGLQAEVTHDLDQATCRANLLHREGKLRALVGVGGDGTAAELANRTVPGVPLTFLPAGTSNLLARHLGLPRDPRRLCQAILEGKTVWHDAGRAGDRLFLAMAGCGFDAHVVRRLDERRRSRGGHISYWSYFKPILDSIRTYQYPELRVQCDEECDAGGSSTAIVARWAFAANLPRYGWGLSLAPQADASDGLLDLCTYRRGGFWAGLRFLLAIELGRHLRWSACVCRKVRRLRITSEHETPYQLDGDPGGWLPLEIEVMPGRLTLIVPRSSREREVDGV